MKRLWLNAGQETSMHFHYAKCETIYVIEGDLRIIFEDVNKPSVILGPGEHHTIREGKINAHRMQSNEGCKYIEASTPHECDSERIRL